MADFFEKLKKGMDIPASAKATAGKGRKRAKKIEIKKEKEDSDIEKVPIEQKDDWLDSEGELTVDVYQTDKEIVIQSAIAGVKPEDLDISIEKDMVIIKGKREKQFEEKEKNYFYQECYWGRFSRKIILPAEVNSSKISASMKNGILCIRIPKIEAKKKTKISVK
ncbi:Hsp20/alpha crystallin family protein [Patescibacteria group bacterium]|nr:Hsp20/alpha crystallin family protein [Patescibacteria group bacterium]